MWVDAEQREGRACTLWPRACLSQRTTRKYPPLRPTRYVRLNRRRLKGSEGQVEATVALSVLHGVLLDLARLMAPFTPFIAEMQYQTLRRYLPPPVSGADGAPAQLLDTIPGPDGAGAPSVHFTSIPSLNAGALDAAREATVESMFAVIEAGRTARERRVLPLKTPVREVLIVCGNGAALDALRPLTPYIADELNALSVRFAEDEEAWMRLVVVPDGAALGKRLGPLFKKLVVAVKALPPAAIAAYSMTGSLDVPVDGAPGGIVTLSGTDVTVRREVRTDVDALRAFEAIVTPAPGQMLVAVNVLQDETTRAMGIAREVVNRVQKLRKRAGLAVGEPVDAFISLAELSAEEFAAAAAGRAEDGEDDEDVTGVAAGAGEPVPAAAAPVGKVGKAPNGAGKPSSAAADAIAPPATAADARALVAAAITSQYSLVQDALRVPVLPFVPTAMSPHAALLDTDVSVVQGARITVALARPGVRFGDSIAAWKAAVNAASDADAAVAAARALFATVSFTAQLPSETTVELTEAAHGVSTTLRLVRGVHYFSTAADTFSPATLASCEVEGGAFAADLFRLAATVGSK